MKTDSTVPPPSGPSEQTVFVHDEIAATLPAPGADDISHTGFATTALDEKFLRSTAQELQSSSEPTAALLHEERARTRRIAPLMAVVAIAAAASLPLFDGTPWAKNLFLASLLSSISATLLLWYLAIKGPVHGWPSIMARATAFAAPCAGTVFFGVFSAAPIAMVIGVVVFSQGRNLRLAQVAYVGAALTLCTVTFLDALGIVPDPGMIQADRLSSSARVGGQLLIQLLLLAAYLLGRFARKSAGEALAKTQEAMRELARRDVIAMEAREEVRRALNIGGVGRLSGVVLGNFRLAEVIGHGGMGEVYKAQHVALGTHAAVKMIHPHLCNDEKLVERFVREAKLSASLDSPHIVRVLDVGMKTVGPFIAMELLEGEDLASYLQKESLLTPPALLELATQVGSGLDAAAQADIVHRDIKPQNLFLVTQSDLLSPAQSSTAKSKALCCKILDFGVARAMSGHATLTVGEAVMGTPAYMAPEQAVGNLVDHRADLHALISVLYRACTGFVPFTGDNAQAILYAVVHKMPKPPSERADLPPSLDAFFEKGFAKDPDKRYQSGSELAQALAQAIEA